MNIENRIAIIDNKIALLERNYDGYINIDVGDVTKIEIKVGDEEGEEFFGISISDKKKPKKFDRRTTSDLVFAMGFNNAIIEEREIRRFSIQNRRVRFC